MISKTSYASTADGQNTACQVELATYKREHTAYTEVLGKNVEMGMNRFNMTKVQQM